jgi:hypothetical protein
MQQPLRNFLGVRVLRWAFGRIAQKQRQPIFGAPRSGVLGVAILDELGWPCRSPPDRSGPSAIPILSRADRCPTLYLPPGACTCRKKVGRPPINLHLHRQSASGGFLYHRDVTSALPVDTSLAGRGTEHLACQPFRRTELACTYSAGRTVLQTSSYERVTTFSARKASDDMCCEHVEIAASCTSVMTSQACPRATGSYSPPSRKLSPRTLTWCSQSTMAVTAVGC